LTQRLAKKTVFVRALNNNREQIHNKKDFHMAGKENIGSVMVIGGGIAGMQSALDLADSGFYVHLIERASTIGGLMAQLDKTFPTNDCTM